MRQLRRAGSWVHADVGTDRVMMNVETGSYVGLSAMGARIWDLLHDAYSIDSLCAALVQRYEVDPDTCRAEVKVFLDDLARAGAVTVESEG
jgi:hypothetical protein